MESTDPKGISVLVHRLSITESRLASDFDHQQATSMSAATNSRTMKSGIWESWED